MKDSDFFKNLGDQSAIEQALAGFAQYASMLSVYKQALVSNGFTEKQAMEVILGFQAIQLSGSVQNGQGGK